MPGRFAVVDTFRLADRGLVAYGDVVSGDVRVGEGLIIPLNSGMNVSARIQSIETVDRSGRSYVGLLLADDELEAGILEALGFHGEELEVAAEELEVSQIPRRATFEEAVERLRRLLRSLQRPDELVWVTPFQVIRGRFGLYVFRPDMSAESEGTARKMFDLAARDCVAVRVGAVASTERATFARVWPIQELGDGEAMFIHDSVKTDVPHENPAVTVVRSRLWWWVIESRYARLRRRRDVMLGVKNRSQGQ